MAKKKGAPKTAKSPETFEFPPNYYALASSLQKQYFVPQPQVVLQNQIITIDHFFSSSLCTELITAFGNLSLETTPLIKSKYYAARFNDRVSMQSPRAAHALWLYLSQLLDSEETRDTFKDACSLNPNLRIYRYTKGHHFGKHYDESVTCPMSHDEHISGQTRWTLLVYLTGGEEFSGGGTIFHELEKPLNIHPSKGMALLHKHGDDCLAHEAQEVYAGTKWVLRSDVTFPKHKFH